MSRTLSTAAKTALFAQETKKVFLVLLEIDHTDLAAPLRFVNDYASITSNGDTYEPIHFDISFPQDSDDQLPKVKLIVDNVGRDLVPTISDYASGLTVSISVVLADTPNTVEIGPIVTQVQTIDFDVNGVTFELGFDDFLNEGFPAHGFTPEDFPGLF